MRTMKRKQPKQPERNTVKKEGLTETLNVKTILLSLLMLLLPPGELFLFYFMNDTDTGSFLTGFITLGMLLLVFVFVFLTGLYQKTFLYNNGAHPERLLGVYVLGLLLVAVNSFLPCQLWLFLPLAVMLMLASGPQTGIGAYLILLYLQELISQPDPVVFVSFALIGMIYGRTHTRDVRELNGLMKVMPFLSVCYVIAGLANLGLPGLSGFVAEMTIFVGSFQNFDVFHRTLTIIACTSIVITAVYILRLVGKILYGTCTNKHHLALTDATWDERFAVICLIVCVAGLGMAPFWISDMISGSVLPVVSNLIP